MLNEFWSSINGRAVKPALSPVFDLTDAPDDEETEGKGGSGSMPSWETNPISGFACVIAYVDAKGRTTQRLITCQRKDAHGSETYLWAYCHDRLAVRQFKLSRIIEVYDARTGEAFPSAASLFEHFQTDRSQRSKPGWGLSVGDRANLTALLNTLVFIAKCDREFHDLERATLDNVISRYWLRFEIHHDPDCDAIVEYAEALAPDAETFFVSLNRCSENAKLTRLMRESVKEMVDADGILAREEMYWGMKVDEFLARAH